MNLKLIIQRFLIPQIIITAYYMLRFRCVISPKAEVEFSPLIKLGRGVTIGSFTKIKATNGPLLIGKKSGIATSCFIAAEVGGVIIGEDVLIGPHVNIMSSNYTLDRDDLPFHEQGSTSRGVRIGNNVWVGAGTAILDGTILNDNTVVTANSLVNRRYPPNVILQGNPAKIIMRLKERNAHETKTSA
ncbi:MAG: acyltransferase [Nitrospirales bacterium]